jgi:peptide chain release factor subunit 1
MRHKAEEHTKRHFRATVETVDTLFLTAGFDLLSIGGPGQEIPEFVDLLPRHLRDRIAGTFTLGDHPTEAAHIRQRAMAILREHESPGSAACDCRRG